MLINIINNKVYISIINIKIEVKNIKKLYDFKIKTILIDYFGLWKNSILSKIIQLKFKNVKRLSQRNYLKGFLKTTFENSLSTNYIDSQKEKSFLCLPNYLIF